MKPSCPIGRSTSHGATKKGSDFSTLCDDLIKGWLADGTIEQLIKDNGLD